MIVCIVGPVFTSKYFGGVATFTESLADAFKILGHDVYLVTDYSERKSTVRNTPIYQVFNKPSRKNIFLPLKLKKTIKAINPELVITSLEYGLVNKLLNDHNKRLKSIHFLHGFPIMKNNKVHNALILFITKYIANNSNFIISNSELTAMINSEIYNIKTDGVCNVCLGYDYIDQVLKSENVQKIPGSILYVGRLIKEKNVDALILAFAKIKVDNVSLTIVGDGPEKDYLMELAKKTGKNIIFAGRISPAEVVDFYMKSEVFISLNPHEPFGIVYLEALAANCKIICPKTGGQFDMLLQYVDRINTVSLTNETDLVESIRAQLGKKIRFFEKSEIVELFSYIKLACQIQDFIKSR